MGGNESHSWGHQHHTEDQKYRTRSQAKSTHQSSLGGLEGKDAWERWKLPVLTLHSYSGMRSYRLDCSMKNRGSTALCMRDNVIARWAECEPINQKRSSVSSDLVQFIACWCEGNKAQSICMRGIEEMKRHRNISCLFIGEELRTAVEEWQIKHSQPNPSAKLTTGFLDGTHPVVDAYELKVCTLSCRKIAMLSEVTQHLGSYLDPCPRTWICSRVKYLLSAVLCGRVGTLFWLMTAWRS